MLHARVYTLAERASICTKLPEGIVVVLAQRSSNVAALYAALLWPKPSPDARLAARILISRPRSRRTTVRSKSASAEEPPHASPKGLLDELSIKPLRKATTDLPTEASIKLLDGPPNVSSRDSRHYLHHAESECWSWSSRDPSRTPSRTPSLALSRTLSRAPTRTLSRASSWGNSRDPASAKEPPHASPKELLD